MKRFRLPLIVVLAGAIAAVVWMRRAEAANETRVSGTVEATEADLGFQLPGRIDAVLAAEGDRVEAGASLAVLDLVELVSARDAADAQRAAAAARLSEMERGARSEERAQADAASRAAARQAQEAATELARARRLHAGGAISDRALEAAETAAEVAASAAERASEQLALVVAGPRPEQVAAQRALVRAAEAQLARADAQLARGTLRAPFSGRVTVRHRQVGEIVAAGMPVFTLQDLDDRWIRVYVREDRIGTVQIGQTASIYSDSHPDKTYEGEVTFIGSEAEFTPRNTQTTEERTKLVYPVKVRVLSDPGFELKPGVPADVILDAPSTGGDGP